MKFFGKTIEGPRPQTIVIPRGEDSAIVFTAKAVLNYDRFDELCKEPDPPFVVNRREGTSTKDLTDVKYRDKLETYQKRRMNWMLITALEDTEGLEWDIVDPNNPETWDSFNKELRTSGFTQSEINMIIEGIMIANSMDEEKMKEARNRFFLSQQQKVES